MSVLGHSIASAIKNSKPLYRFLKPLADRYASLAGYRQHGLKYDDLLIEENPVVQKVSYLPPSSFPIVFRIVCCTVVLILPAFCLLQRH